MGNLVWLKLVQMSLLQVNLFFANVSPTFDLRPGGEFRSSNQVLSHRSQTRLNLILPRTQQARAIWKSIRSLDATIKQLKCPKKQTRRTTMNSVAFVRRIHHNSSGNQHQTCSCLLVILSGASKTYLPSWMTELTIYTDPVACVIRDAWPSRWIHMPRYEASRVTRSSERRRRWDSFFSTDRCVRLPGRCWLVGHYGYNYQRLIMVDGS